VIPLDKPSLEGKFRKIKKCLEMVIRNTGDQALPLVVGNIISGDLLRGA